MTTEHYEAGCGTVVRTLVAASNAVMGGGRVGMEELSLIDDLAAQGR